jgi:DNA ligase-1
LKIKLYKNHGKEIGYWIGEAKDAEVIMSHARNLNGSEVTRSYTAEPKNIGKANETTPEAQAILEVEARARKKRDEGYVDSLEEAKKPVTNSLGLKKPMLATPLEKVKPEKIDWGTAYVQPKLDGHRALWCPESQQLYSRQGKKIDMPHIEEVLKGCYHGKLPLDGELYAHGLELQEVSKLIKKYRPESQLVQFHVYDLVDETKPFSERIRTLEKFGSIKHITVVQTEFALDHDDLMNTHSCYREMGYEGTMLRFGTSGYQTGKRSRELLKVKEFHDDEFEIVGCVGGKETELNGYKAVPAVWICKAPNEQLFQVLSQGTMQEKADQYISQDLYIGKQLTVKYHYLSKDGIPQLPIALRFREDV